MCQRSATSSHKYKQKRQELKYAAARKVVLVGPMNPESMKLIIALIQEEES
jgi:hypothetical protein